MLGLPEEVLAAIGGQYRAAVASARESYPLTRADEDSVTGALLHSMHEKVRGSRGDWHWATHPKKLRGRGKGAGEKHIGADLAIEMEVREGELKRKKTLFVQAKKEWRGRDRLLSGQARKLADLPGGALVVDYQPHAFRSITAKQALAVDGNARGIAEGEFRDLGDVLAEDFLACRIGSTAIHYDAGHETLIVHDGEGLRLIQFTLGERIRTEVSRKVGR